MSAGNRGDFGFGRAEPAAVPIGGIVLWASDTPPEGWLLCDGKQYERSLYAELFAVIGTAFGVIDNRQFSVPDLRGRLPLGQDDMGGTSANRVTAASADSIGGSAGAESVTLATSEMPAHDHRVRSSEGPTLNKISLSDNTGFAGFNNGDAGYTVGGNLDLVENTGGGSAKNVMNPYLTLNYIIKAKEIAR